MHPFFPSPATVVAWWTMMAEAQIVASMRMLALAGVVPMTRGDRNRMFAEKGPAFAAAAMAATMAAMGGKSADAVMQAALRPVGRRTRINLRRVMRG